MGLAGQHPTVVLPAGAAADDFAFQPPLDRTRSRSGPSRDVDNPLDLEGSDLGLDDAGSERGLRRRVVERHGVVRDATRLISRDLRSNGAVDPSKRSGAVLANECGADRDAQPAARHEVEALLILG
jgi:hypothetical protein